MEKLSRRLFFPALPGVAAAFGLAEKAKPAIVVDEPVSGAAIMARAPAERCAQRTTIQRLLDEGWTPRYYMRAKIGHTIRFWKTRPFVPYENPYLWDFEHVLTLDSPAMVDEWNALVDADRKWWEETIASRTVVPQRLHEQDVTGQPEYLFSEAHHHAFTSELDAIRRESQVEILQWLQPTPRLGLGLGDKERL